MRRAVGSDNAERRFRWRLARREEIIDEVIEYLDSTGVAGGECRVPKRCQAGAQNTGGAEFQ